MKFPAQSSAWEAPTMNAERQAAKWTPSLGNRGRKAVNSPLRITKCSILILSRYFNCYSLPATSMP